MCDGVVLCCACAAVAPTWCAVTPPGFKTVVSGNTGTTEPCGDGEYR